MADVSQTNGTAMLRATRGLGVAMTFILASQIYPFMLSSAFTARNIVQEQNDVEGVQIDMWIALGLSLAADSIIAYYLNRDPIILAMGFGFSIMLFLVYSVRGDIPILW